MSWHFRGSLARIEFERRDRILLPFAGCAWLAGAIGPAGNPEANRVHDAHLELVRHDDLLIRAIAAEAADIAERFGTPSSQVSGCIYYLGGAVRIVTTAHDDTMTLIQRSLLTPLAEGRFYLNAAIDFPGFVADDAPHDAGTLSRQRFYDGQGALYFEQCSITIGFNDWALEPAPPSLAPRMPAQSYFQPRL